METTQTTTVDLDWVMTELAEGFGKLPIAALRAAQAHPDLIIPRLIESLEQAASTVLSSGKVDGSTHFFALFLLTEFRAQEAWPAIRRAISLPGDGPHDLFGSAITETLCRVLAVFCAESTQVLDELIADGLLDEFVRWAAASTFLLLVRDGRLTRDEAVDRLRKHLRNAMENDDSSTATAIVCELIDYAASESFEDVRTAFQRNLVDESVIDLDFFESDVAAGDDHFEVELERCRPTGIEDTVAELSHWASFREPSESLESPLVSKVLAAMDPEDFKPRYEIIQREPDYPPLETIRNSQPRIGRNEPCPCGSGKKFKKCCGAN